MEERACIQSRKEHEEDYRLDADLICIGWVGGGHAIHVCVAAAAAVESSPHKRKKRKLLTIRWPRVVGLSMYQ